MGNLRAPVVPVAVHQVLGGIGPGLGKGRIRIGGDFHAAVDAGNIQNLVAVGGEEVVVYPFRDVGEFLAFAQFPALPGRAVELPALQEIHRLPVWAPAGR